ncbi:MULTISPECIES: ABC transporter permease [Rhodococcus]|uniref:ABC transporter permease n=1 Tax=Rhodococcus TaxID=1827 RepID=UPI001ED8F12A|nr:MULTISPECIES: ABC transporter permease [Rhodococcus]
MIVRELRDSRELLANLARREIRGKYKATALGQLWSLANPLAAMAIYTVVFAYIIRIRPAPGDPSGLDVFALWLLCALLPWTFFTNVVNGGILSLVGNENLIKKVFFPRIALVVANSVAVLFAWSIEMAVLLVALLIAGAHVLPWLPLVVVFMVLMWLFATGVSMMAAIGNVYFRDTQHFVTIFFQVWFYLTPIVYPASLVGEQSERLGPVVGSVTVFDLYQLNPLEQFAQAFRTLLYDNQWPALPNAMACVVCGVAAFLLGCTIFKRHEKGLAEAL